MASTMIIRRAWESLTSPKDCCQLLRLLLLLGYVLAALLNSTQLPHEDEMDDLSDPFWMPVSGARGSILPNRFGDKVCNWFILESALLMDG